MKKPAFWPGPLTLVVDKAARVSPLVTGGADSVAIRAPSHRVARALISAVGAPLVAPSANRYQTLSPTRAEHVASSRPWWTRVEITSSFCGSAESRPTSFARSIRS